MNAAQLLWLALWLGGALLVLAVVVAPRRPAAGARAAGRSGWHRPLGLAAASALPVLMVTRSLPAAGVTSLLAAWAARSAATRGRERQDRQRREAWPDAIDSLASAVRAGLGLPEALADLGRRGPEPLRPAFRAYGADLATTGSFGIALDRLKAGLADPVADRVAESLRVAREVGGTELGRLLRTLSTTLREEGRLRAEVVARQSWTVNAARLAVGAPWLTLAVLALRPRSLAAYATPAGMAVLAGAAATCWIAYRGMVRIGRLPHERRVLR